MYPRGGAVNHMQYLMLFSVVAFLRLRNILTIMLSSVTSSDANRFSIFFRPSNQMAAKTIFLQSLIVF